MDSSLNTYRQYWPVVALLMILIGLLTVTLIPYRGNVTALFHMDREVAARGRYPLPVGFIVLTVPAYDGAQYYQIARSVPQIFTAEWPAIRSSAPGAYAYQRFLLPVLAWLLTLGQESLLPYAFLLINLGSLLLTAMVLLKKNIKPLYVLAITLSPAATVAMHFSLAEPLTILLLTFFLLRTKKSAALEPLDLLLLSLLVITREVNILFIAFLGAFLLWKQRWHDVFLLIVPLTAFFILHGWIYHVFGSVPFLLSTGNRSLPFSSPLKILLDISGTNRLTLSSIALLLLFVFPALTWTLHEIIRHRRKDILTIGSFIFLLLMSMMSPNIWGSITSIGRVITPVYPLVLLAASERDTTVTRAIAIGVLLLGIAIAIGLALTAHPFILS